MNCFLGSFAAFLFLSLPPSRGKVPPKGADEGALLRAVTFLAGALSFDARGFRRPAASACRARRLGAPQVILQGFALRGEVLSQRWESTQRIAGGRLRMGTDVPIFALPPVPHYGGRVLVRLCNISGAQNLSGFLRFIPGHWALSAAKFVPGAVFGLRLSLPSQLSQCVYRRRGVHCAPVKPSTSQGEGGTRSVTDEGASWLAQPPAGAPGAPLRKTGSVPVIL